MNDDELSRFLQSEVPEPGAGYWEEIDRRLQQAQADLSTGPQAETGDGHLAATPGTSEAGETNENVIRLTDMNQTTLPQKQSFAPIVLAAAAVMLVAVGSFALLRNSNTALSTDTVGPADQSSDADGSGGSSATDDAADEESADGSDSATDAIDDPAATSRTCYAGSNAATAEDPETEISAWVERSGDTARIAILLEGVDFREIEAGEGTIGADGLFTGVTRTNTGFETQVDTLVVTEEALTDTEEPISIPAVPCDEVARQMQLIDEGVAELEDGLTDEDDAQEGFSGQEPARVWTVVGDQPVAVLASPGEPDSVLTTVAVGELLGGAGAAVTTAADDVRWLSTYQRLADGTAVFGWVSEDDVEATDWAGWLCFSSDNPGSVLAFDPLAPADSPLGAFVMLPDEDPLANQPQVSVIASAPLSNPDEAGDELAVFVQVGDGWEQQAWSQTSFGVSTPDLTWGSVPCDQVNQGLSYIEGFRTEIALP